MFKEKKRFKLTKGAHPPKRENKSLHAKQHDRNIKASLTVTIK